MSALQHLRHISIESHFSVHGMPDRPCVMPSHPVRRGEDIRTWARPGIGRASSRSVLTPKYGDHFGPHGSVGHQTPFDCFLERPTWWSKSWDLNRSYLSE